MVQAASASDLATGLRVLSDRNFRWFFLGQCASMLGDGMVAPALAFAILDLTGHVVRPGTRCWRAGTASQVLFILAGGVIADWLPRNVLMLGSDLLRTVSQGIMAMLLITGAAQLWQLLAAPGGARRRRGAVHAGRARADPGDDHAPSSGSRPTRCAYSPCPARSSPARRWPACSSSRSGPGVGHRGRRADVRGQRGLPVAAAAGLRRYASAGCRFSRDLADGWREFRSRRWVWSVIAAASADEPAVRGLLGARPGRQRRSFGGAGAWALISAIFGAGLPGRRRRRPVRAPAVPAALGADRDGGVRVPDADAGGRA